MLRRLAGVVTAALVLVLPAAAHAQPNDFACKPSAKHPLPVVLVHGTYLNSAESWNSMAPALEQSGYCVFEIDYGNNATGDIPTSAGQVRAFIDEVMSKTGASRVSIVGHSQGGMMPRYIIKFLGRANRIDDLIGLSPSNHGTTNPLAGPSGPAGCTACAQQVAGSDFINHLNAGDETPAPVDYTVIQTSHDEVVTPFDSAFLPATSDGRVTNVLLQDRCPNDAAEHIGMPYDPVAIQWVLNALGRAGPADSKFVPDCNALTPPPDQPGGNPGGGAKPGRLVIGGARRHGRRLHVALTVRGRAVKHAVVRLRSHGRTIGRSKPVRVARRRVVRLRPRVPLARGKRYRLVARGTSAGKAVTAKKSFRLR
ncbi:MAG: hypothetical protein QOG63_2494 [Thermoleophilaceae bacterium]|nr:hypothetical protein [Thermoleophilaceae bacterium]